MNKCLSLLFLPFVLFARLDVVIPVHEKDSHSLDIILDALVERVDDIGTIYIISPDKYTDRAIWIDEKLYPFSKIEVAREIGACGGIGTHHRVGWYYQQLLKFYIPEVIEGISQNFLIFDADTIPTGRVSFCVEDGKIIHFVQEGEALPSYYSHAERVLADLKGMDRDVNPIVNHMVFSKDILCDLFAKVEEAHGKEFWKVFLNKVDVSKGLNKRGFQVGASEYLIYYLFCQRFHQDKVEIRTIRLNSRAKSFDKRYYRNYDFITRHLFVEGYM